MRKSVRGEITEYLFIMNRWFTVSLHKLSSVDNPPPVPHDHPSDFLSIGLWGGYTECLFPNPGESLRDFYYKKRRAGTMHVMRNTAGHYITAISPRTWTLFITWNYQHRRPMLYTSSGPMTAQEFYSKGYAG